MMNQDRLKADHTLSSTYILLYNLYAIDYKNDKVCFLDKCPVPADQKARGRAKHILSSGQCWIPLVLSGSCFVNELLWVSIPYLWHIQVQLHGRGSWAIT